VCQYNAIASLPNATMLFTELCHGCGSCTLNCPAEAISEVPRTIGVLEMGTAGGPDRAQDKLDVAQGTLNVGEAMATPVIRALKDDAASRAWDRDPRLLVIDAPPGNACPVLEALRGADAVVLVTEPTPFGLHDLRLAVSVARDVLGLPLGVVINRDDSTADRSGKSPAGDGSTPADENTSDVADGSESDVAAYCRQEGLPIWLRIPLSREIAEAYSRGLPLVRAMPRYREPFSRLLTHIIEAAKGENA
jgi:MinD superfamily P-loop ATPase